MSLRRTVHGLLLLVAAIAAVTAVVPAAPAQAATYPGYSHVSASYSFGSGYYTGGYVDCPTGKLPVAAGAVNSDPGGMLLSGSTTETSDIWRTYTKRATCPAGYVAYGGGGNVVQPTGSYDVIGLYTHGTVPEGRSWSYAGTGGLGARMLRVETECVPRARLGRIATVTATATGPAVVQSRHSLVASVRCPDGYVAFAGGGYLHATGSGVSTWDGYLRANLMAADDRGWTVVGDTFKPNTQLTVKVRCTDRLG